MAERFGVVENRLGDVLGMAADNDAQLANYLTQKGQILGSAKVLQRQSEVVARLPQNLRDELMKERYKDLSLKLWNLWLEFNSTR